MRWPKNLSSEGRVAMGCAGSKVDADTWIQPQSEPTPRQADAVVKESPHTSSSTSSRKVRPSWAANHRWRRSTRSPAAASFSRLCEEPLPEEQAAECHHHIFGADTEMAAVVTGPEAPAEGGLSNRIMGGQMGQSRGGSDMSAGRRAASCSLPRLSTHASAVFHKKMHGG